MKVYLIGTGMEGEKTLTREAMDAISEAELLVGAERMLAPYKDSRKTFQSNRPQEIADRLNSGTEAVAAVLVSGDCGFFSAAGLLRKYLKNAEIYSICGIATPVYFCARLGLSWENMKFVSLHSAERSIAVHVRSNRYCCFLLGGSITVAKLCARLCEYGLENVTVCVGENLGYEDEKIRCARAKDLCSYEAKSLTAVITDNPDHCAYLPSGLPDAEFVRGDVPMTKSVVRSTAVAALNIRSSDICWDIGCGTGSVSVEMALRCPEGYVCALDKSFDALRLTEENRRRFGCDNILLYQGEAAEACRELVLDRRPDKVFIGGSGGELAEILQVVHDSNPAALIVMTAVSLETLQEAVEVFSSLDGTISVTQIAVTNTRRVGSHTMLTAENPVFLIKGSFPCEGS